MKLKNRNFVLIIGISVIIVFLLMGLEYGLQRIDNRHKAYQTSELLLDQVKTVVDNTDNNLRSLTASLKEDYVTRAKAVSYILDSNPKLEEQITELAWIANLISVDEIHLLDDTGTIYGGTKPQAYGYSFDSGAQLAGLSRMLETKNFSMCQGLMPNTVEGKMMMFAICWNPAGTRMTMVGIEPTRLMNEMSASEISEVIDSLPRYEGTDIIVIGIDDTIEGASDDTLLGKTASDIGLVTESLSDSETKNYDGIINSVPSYYTVGKYEKYKIAIVQSKAEANRGIFIPLILTLIYMIVAVTVLMIVIKHMTIRIVNEHKNANSDAMTTFFNRRAYENDLSEYADKPYEDNLVYISMDLNGLKRVNDNLGHEEGDRMIVGSAECIQQCFGNYGKVYRIGGDEFAALIFADEEKLDEIKRDFDTTLVSWSDLHDRKLAVSCGYVRTSEFPDMTPSEIAKLADERMYIAKDEYYRSTGEERRV